MQREPGAQPEGGRQESGPDERELAARAGGGDLLAFETLYRMSVGRVYALCLRLTGEKERAQRLTQDAFVRAWEKLPGFRGEAAFSSWLYRLTVNVVLQDQRSRRRRLARHQEAAAEIPPSPSTAPGLETRLDLEQAIARLPERARTVFLLHDVEGYRHEEIAEMTGTAVGTSKAQLHRARRLLREMLRR
jgi:RNA polymerase sigma-70 factor (ECF subfamily)